MCHHDEYKLSATAESDTELGGVSMEYDDKVLRLCAGTKAQRKNSTCILNTWS